LGRLPGAPMSAGKLFRFSSKFRSTLTFAGKGALLFAGHAIIWAG
jgi:hypothetical protein